MPVLDALTDRELEIITLLAEGHTNKSIADQLFLALSTVKWYIRQLNSKFDTNNRSEIVKRANEMGLLNEDEPVVERQHHPRHNLPRQTTSFIGRDNELDDIHAIINQSGVRLLTILAPGGMGKTRIALEACEQQINNYTDGVYFVALQPLSAPNNIVPQIAKSIGFHFSNDGSDVQQQVLDFLSNKHMLLLMDNWEHLLDGVPIINEILQVAPDVKIIATSREKLNLLGEAVYVLKGMEFPTWETPEDALQYDAVQLLVQTAQRMQPAWDITSENLDYVARVCRLTQGMPLGILLAMSWLDVLPIHEIANEIEKNVNFLETDMRDIPERQQSIRAVFNSTWTKLSATEQIILAKMAVFRGGFDRTAANKVTGATLRNLQSFINRSLLQMDKTGRYDLHELLRQFTEQKLAELGESDLTRNHHMDYYASKMQTLEDSLKDYRQVEALDTIEGDFENVRIAWLWAIEQINQSALDAIQTSLSFFSLLRSRSEEILTLYRATTILEGRINQELWERLLAQQGYIYEKMGNFTQAQQLVEPIITTLRECKSCSGLPLNLYRLSTIMFWQGEAEHARILLEEALILFAEKDDLWGQAWSKSILGVIHATNLDDLSLGYQLNKEAYDFFRQAGTPDGLAQTAQNLGIFELAIGTVDVAQKYFRESLACYEKIGGNWWWGKTNTLSWLVNIDLYRNHFDNATALGEIAYEEATESGRTSEMMVALGIRTRIQLAQEQYQSSLDTIDEIQVLSDHNDDLKSMLMRSMALCGLERYQDADILIDKILLAGFDVLQPQGVLQMLFVKSVIFAQHGQPERALDMFGLVSSMPHTRLWCETHPLALKLDKQLREHFDQNDYQNIRKRGQAKVNIWYDVVKTLVDEIKTHSN